MDLSLLAFWGLAAVGLASALLMVTRKNLVHAALYLVVTFFVVAAIYVLLQAEFLAAVQVLVYAGGIMVLYLFVILLVNVPRDESSHPRRRPVHAAVALGLTLLTVGLLAAHLAGTRTPPADPAAEVAGNIETVSIALYRNYLLPFEAVSILLLVAMIAAIVLARGERAKEGTGR